MLGCVTGCPISHEFWRSLHSKIGTELERLRHCLDRGGAKSNSFFSELQKSLPSCAMLKLDSRTNMWTGICTLSAQIQLFFLITVCFVFRRKGSIILRWVQIRSKMINTDCQNFQNSNQRKGEIFMASRYSVKSVGLRRASDHSRTILA